MRRLPNSGHPLSLAGERYEHLEQVTTARERIKWHETRRSANTERRNRDHYVKLGFREPREVTRVCEIERYAGPSDETIERVLELLVLPDCPSDITLLDTQILALATLVETRSLAGFITTGAGKTLIMLLGMRALGLKRGVALIRPDLIEQAVDEVEVFGPCFNFDERLHLLSYGVLQHPMHVDLLWELRPQVVFADEADELGNTLSARWIRVRDYHKDEPECIFVPMSGSLSTAGILDYSHLLELALGPNTPFPRLSSAFGKDELKSWARCLDTEGIPRRTDIAALAELGDAFDGKPLSRVDTLSAWQREIRGAYARRLKSTPGVLIVDKASWPGKIILEEHRKPAIPEELQNIIDDVLETGESPDGTIVFADDDEIQKAISELVCGFWYRWDWPDTIALDEQIAWRLARADISRFVRHEIKERGAAGYDSRFNVLGAVSRQIARKGGEAELPIEVAYVDWLEWREKLRERLEAVATRDNSGSGVKPPTVPVWVSDYLVNDCIAWLEEHTPAVLWYRHRAFGKALEELDVTVYNTAKRRGDLASILRRRGAHNAALPYACVIGRNLQRYSVARMAGIPPANSKAIEQLFGRFARKGQAADEILMWADATNKYAIKALERARRGAQGVLEREGIGQKMLDAERRIVL